jgi:hypothetical protein
MTLGKVTPYPGEVRARMIRHRRLGKSGMTPRKVTQGKVALHLLDAQG